VPDANTTVTLVRAFKRGDSLALSGTPAAPAPPVAASDLCLVKLRIGPGHPGPAGAPSTSAGIGVEAWLPSVAAWNRRFHAIGGAGWYGGAAISATTVIGDTHAAAVAAVENAVTAVTDTGHTATDGSFAMNPDGSINTVLWTDFARRATHEMTFKVKALAAAYYGANPAHSYWDGCSTGGRQGLMEAQADPGDFDGILAGAPAIHWTQFTIGGMYPQVVMNLEPGGPIAPAKQATAGAAAINACDTRLTGAHDGYLSDPAACAYDPTADPAVLCAASGGTNSSPACLTTVEARAMNKIWYGQTSDGSVPSPAADNGFNATLAGDQLWFGLARGTDLTVLTGAAPVDLGSDQLALNLQNPAYARPTFVNATGNGADQWKTLTYAGPNSIANAFAQGLTLNGAFGGINTDNPDLSLFRDRGGKLILYHGLADTLIPPQGTMNYYTRVAQVMGGFPKTQQFARLFVVPGLGHCASSGSVGGGSPPLPAPGQMYQVLVDWVETGAAPGSIVVGTTAGTPRNRPLCMYPSQLTYLGGDVNHAASFTCQ
jgi:feruloyl esterase